MLVYVRDTKQDAIISRFITICTIKLLLHVHNTKVHYRAVYSSLINGEHSLGHN